MPSKEVLIHVENLSMLFPNGKKKEPLRAVDNVTLDIYRGETLGLVGESGCGKTTFGRCLLRLYDPQEGTITFDGQEISGKMTPAKRKLLVENTSMIFQDPISSLNPRMMIKEIIGEALKTQKNVSAEDSERIIRETIQKVGLLPEHLSRYPHEFSGGQRQRIGIARSLVLKPPFIIADEPISALDVSIRAQVLNLLQDLKEEMELTILFIAHDLSVVKYFSDRIGVMYFGKLVEIADADELYARPLHPYTQALLSAIPVPDPRAERKRELITYSRPDRTSEADEDFIEVFPAHFVRCTQEYAQKLRAQYNQALESE